MSIDLTQFHAAFYEEAFEALASMEETLLGLNVGQPEPESINTIFRVAHSIKGGAATFGFTPIVSFTHSLETLLDELRGQRMQINQTLLDLLLRSVDILRELLRAQQSGREADAQAVADLQFDLELTMAQKGKLAAQTLPAPAAPASGTLYEIHFRPYLHLLARGNDPLRMFRELRELGELQTHSDTSAVPELGAFDPENCYLSWRLVLRTDASRQSVVEVFDWAEGDCDLVIRDLAPQATTAPVNPERASESAPAADTVAEVRTAKSEPAKSADSSSIRVSTEKIDDLMNSVGELVITQSMLGQLMAPVEGALGERLRAGLAHLERNVRELQESVMRVRMVPISFVFSRFPRMVRDLSQRLNKQVELKLTGGDTELDKTVLEKIGDPLVHLVRNSIDHGIERPEVRVAAGKPAIGTVHLHAYHRGSSITVEVSDDGAGLNRERIVAKARERGLVSADESLTDEQICNLIFLAGFSTNDQATDISGRGVGMDVVRRNVEELGGLVEVNAPAGQGARFTITLPLTLAIVDGQTVSIGEESYIVPLTAIVESLQISTASVSHVVGHGEVLSFRGEYLPVVRLQQVFNAPGSAAAESHAKGLIMVVEGDGRRVGLCVDELLGQQQVVVKTLEANYGHVDGIAGATILGDGSVALILDVAGLTRSVSEKLAA